MQHASRVLPTFDGELMIFKRVVRGTKNCSTDEEYLLSSTNSSLAVDARSYAVATPTSTAFTRLSHHHVMHDGPPR